MENSKLLNGLLLLILLSLFLSQAFFYPNFLQSEENHYLWVSSYLFQHGNWLVLQDQSGVYLNKPPLLFWLINSAWHVLGYHPWVVHAVLSAILLALVVTTMACFRVLFPDHNKQSLLVAFILLGCAWFLQRSYVLAFESMLCLSFALSFLGLLMAMRSRYAALLLWGAGMGVGILSKGPIILIFALIPWLIATFLHRSFALDLKRWFIYSALGFMLTIMMVLAWLVPFLTHLTKTQIDLLIWHKALGAGHQYGSQPIWTYLVKYPQLLLPWLFWPALWVASLELFKKPMSREVKFLLLSSLVIFIGVSLAPSRISRYILPLLPLSVIFFTVAIVSYRSNKVDINWDARIAYGVIGLLCVASLVLIAFMPHTFRLIVGDSGLSLKVYAVIASSLAVISAVWLFWKTPNLTTQLVKLSCYSMILVYATVLLPREIVSNEFDYARLVAFVKARNEQGETIYRQTRYGGLQYSVPGLLDLTTTKPAVLTPKDSPYWLVLVSHDFRYVRTGQQVMAVSFPNKPKQALVLTRHAYR